MSSVQQTGHHCWSRTNKVYTNFKWSLDDWSVLSHHYKAVKSSEFELHEMNGKTCMLYLIYVHSYGAIISFPNGIEYPGMKATLSIIDGKSTKQNRTEAIFQNSEKLCVLFFEQMLKSVPRTWLVNDTLTLFLELMFVTPVKTPTLCTEILDKNFSTDICKHFKVMLDSKDLYDVTFVVRGKKLYAHKVILAANSDVFRAMFTTQMKEQIHNIVEIVDTDATVFEVFLRYMYTGRVIEFENVINELIAVADKYQVMNLKNVCERYMSNHVN